MPERTATVATYTASGTAVTAGAVPLIFGLTPSEIGAWCAIGGFLIGVITAGFNVWFQWDRRQRELKGKMARRIFESKP